MALIVAADPSKGKTVKRSITARAGRWHITVPGLAHGTATLTVETLDDTTGDGFNIRTIHLGPKPETAFHRRVRLLEHNGVVGLSSAAVRRQLGAPDHSQRIAGQRFVYYELRDQLYQLVIAGDVVSQVNAY